MKQENYKVLRAGLDGLDVSFQVVIPDDVLKSLRGAKNEAVKADEPKLVDVGFGVEFMVAQTGAKGGYAFRCDTGPEGETWFIKDSTKEDWNIRISCKSAMLAIRGYEGAKAHMLEVMQRMGVKVIRESVGRVDYAMDFTAPESFELRPELMVARTNCGKKPHTVRHNLKPQDLAEGIQVWKARRVQSVTMGKMPNRQLIVYDKTAEVAAHGKAYWWKFWGVPAKTQVWRIEVRGGKKFLKERLGVSTWEDLEKELMSIVECTLQQIRMCDPWRMKESNVSRTGFHPMWEAALAYIRERFAESLHGMPVRVIREERKRMAEIFKAQLRGGLVSFANVCGVTRDSFTDWIAAVMREVEQWHDQRNTHFKKKWNASEEKYKFLRGAYAYAS